jgi:hypothetical protein
VISRIPIQIRSKTAPETVPEGAIRFVRVPVNLQAGSTHLFLPDRMSETDALAVVATVLQHTAASLQDFGPLTD